MSSVDFTCSSKHLTRPVKHISACYPPAQVLSWKAIILSVMELHKQKENVNKTPREGATIYPIAKRRPEKGEQSKQGLAEGRMKVFKEVLEDLRQSK